MREGRGKENQPACISLKPPGFTVIRIPLLWREFDLLPAVFVEIDFVITVGLDLEHARDIAVRMSVLVMMLSRLSVVAPTLGDSEAYVVLGVDGGLEIFRDRIFDE